MKRSWRVTALFSLMTFITLALTMLVMFSLAMLLSRSGFIPPRRGFPLAALAISSVAVGTVLSKFVGRRFLRVIEEISAATQEVARGNFSVKLNENIRTEEFQRMAHSFNLMTRELPKTEMLRSDFISNVSHEFKTPLAAIDGYVTLLQSPYLTEDKRLEYTQRILRSTKRLSALVSNILILSRLEYQEGNLKTERFSLDEQIREAVLSLENEWENKSIDMDVELENAEFYGSGELLIHVWQNLIGNAIKFIQTGGRIQIRLTKGPDAIIVSIADNGPGMAPDVAHRVYEKFYQGDPSHSADGNGLGLALVKKIVNLHDGGISLSSREGEGTVFTVRLPGGSNEKE